MSIGGFPSTGNTAPTHDRYVGLYHFSGYWGKWDVILGFTHTASGERFMWTVQAVDVEGNPTGEVRTHCTPMHADMFADRPFAVSRTDLRSLKG